MEPRLPAPHSGLELPQVNYGQNLEQSSPIASPERTTERGGERLEQRGEMAPAVAVPTLPTPVVALPTPIVVVDDTAADDTPIAAADEDLIEKEWVDQAKKIILQTKDDPYRREQEVSRLQADYLRKRYGKELGSSL